MCDFYDLILASTNVVYLCTSQYLASAAIVWISFYELSVRQRYIAKTLGSNSYDHFQSMQLAQTVKQRQMFHWHNFEA